VLGGEALKLYTRTMLESDSKATQSKKQSSHDKCRGQRGLFSVEREIEKAQRERRDEGTCATATLAYP
jgi:hypothetical protein